MRLPFKTCTDTTAACVELMKQLYNPESLLFALAINNVEFAPFSNISVLTLKIEDKGVYYSDANIEMKV